MHNITLKVREKSAATVCVLVSPLIYNLCFKSDMASPSSSSATPVNVKKPKIKQTNFSSQEDEDLAKAWLEVGQDPIRGAAQKVEVFWQHIFDVFASRNAA